MFFCFSDPVVHWSLKRQGKIQETEIILKNGLHFHALFLPHFPFTLFFIPYDPFKWAQERSEKQINYVWTPISKWSSLCKQKKLKHLSGNQICGDS